MLIALAKLAAGFALLYFGGESVVRGATNLAQRARLDPLVIGLTVLAFGTSAPELVVSLAAALREYDAVALGNVTGSNICNITLILGLAAIFRPVRIHAQLLRLDVPVMLACTGALLLALADGRVGRLDAGLMLAALAGYLIFSIRKARRESEPLHATMAEALPPVMRTGPMLGALLGGLLLLAVGGDVFVGGAVTLAEGLGVSQAVIALTVVAVGTSLPELATTVVASIRDQGDMAVGNLVGSNIFNILAILGITGAIHPVARASVTWIDLGVMAGVALLLAALLLYRRRHTGLARPEAGLLLAIYAGYTGWLLLA